VTAREPDHAEFDELAAGHALDALDPADEERFARHAEGCLRCQQTLAGFRQVAAALAETAPPAEPSPRLPALILAAVAGTGWRDRPAAGTGEAAGAGGGAVPLAPVAPLRGRPGRGGDARRWRRPAAVAAAAALIAGGGIWAGLAATAGGPPASPLASCARPHACDKVTLTASATHRPAATVVVQRGVAWMEPGTMAANPADDIYVLWQIGAGQPPVAVGAFSVRPGTSGPIRIGGLALPYAHTEAFAVSLEHGRTIPPSPSKPVAVGVVS
jgi:hypothetical protein